MHLKDLGVDLEQEDNTAGFMGVTLQQESNTVLLEILRTGLIQRVNETVELDGGMVKVKFTHSEKRPLVKDVDGKPPSSIFRYISIVDMIIYLLGHTCPYKSFTIN